MQEVLTTINDLQLLIKSKLNAQEIINCKNQVIKRELIERFGYKRLVKALKGEIIHKHKQSELIRVNIKEDEPLVVVKVIDPSTKDIYLLRVRI